MGVKCALSDAYGYALRAYRILLNCLSIYIDEYLYLYVIKRTYINGSLKMRIVE